LTYWFNIIEAKALFPALPFFMIAGWDYIWDKATIIEEEQCGYTSHTFDKEGNFKVELTVWDDSCNIHSKTDEVIIHVIP